MSGIEPLPGLRLDDRAWCSNRDVQELRERAEKAEARVKELEPLIAALKRVAKGARVWRKMGSLALLFDAINALDVVEAASTSEPSEPDNKLRAYDLTDARAWLNEIALDEGVPVTLSQRSAACVLLALLNDQEKSTGVGRRGRAVLKRHPSSVKEGSKGR